MSTGRSTTVRDRDRRAIARTKPPCGICKGEIDYSLTVLVGSHGRYCKGGDCSGCTPHPMRYEVDHIIALDNGGTDTLDNKQASHRKCNRDKWNKSAESSGPRTFVTSRSW